MKKKPPSLTQLITQLNLERKLVHWLVPPTMGLFVFGSWIQCKKLAVALSTLWQNTLPPNAAPDTIRTAAVQDAYVILVTVTSLILCFLALGMLGLLLIPNKRSRLLMELAKRAVAAEGE